MPSSYSNLGIEKIDTGEQSGVWGNTTNTNFDILDDSISGVFVQILTSDVTLAVSDGATSGKALLSLNLLLLCLRLVQSRSQLEQTPP